MILLMALVKVADMTILTIAEIITKIIITTTTLIQIIIVYLIRNQKQLMCINIAIKVFTQTNH